MVITLQNTSKQIQFTSKVNTMFKNHLDIMKEK